MYTEDAMSNPTPVSKRLGYFDRSILEPSEDDFEARIEEILCEDDDWSMVTARPVTLSQRTIRQYSLDDIPFP